VQQLNAAIDKVLREPTARDRLSALGATPMGGSAQSYQTLIANDYEIWGRTIRSAGITSN